MKTLLMRLLAGAMMCTVAAGAAQAAPDKALLKAKLDAARKTYELTWKNYREGLRGAEYLYWWSRRWMEAQRELAEGKAEQIAAVQGHAERMRELERVVQNLQRAKVGTLDEKTAAEFYRLEAEIWLQQAKE